MIKFYCRANVFLNNLTQKEIRKLEVELSEKELFNGKTAYEYHLLIRYCLIFE